jgi:RimJ/RimL family protein N-acetyltransferase
MRCMHFRLATEADVDPLVAVQEEGATRALSHIFPQDVYPFPRETLRSRWREEIADSCVSAYVIVDDNNEVVGFAATRADELLHFGTAISTWGTGLAVEAHDAVINALDAEGVVLAKLHVFEQNQRARRFYEKLGWQQTANRSRTPFPPYPVLIEYRRSISGDGIVGSPTAP